MQTSYLAGKKLAVKKWGLLFLIFYRQSFTGKSDSPFHNQAALGSCALRCERFVELAEVIGRIMKAGE